ncbi:MAG: S66 peptidase family protein [Gemmatimonadaceae bacterium]
MRFPDALASGARVALVAPSGPLAGDADLVRAVENARTLGWEPVQGTNAAARDNYLAGSDEDRLVDLQRAISDDTIDAIWCLRGGYGAMRLLPALDFSPLARRPKAIIGYSDITAIHAAVGRATGIVSYHGPTARAEISAFSLESLQRAVVRQVDSCGTAPSAHTIVPGRAAGPLAGGNLAMLASLAGTPYAPSYDGVILVLEDVSEYTYRVDRMLTQLTLAGSLGRIAGLAFGAFTETPADDNGGTPALVALLERTARALRVPAVRGVPVGHIADQWTLPLGAHAELDADACALHVAVPA